MTNERKRKILTLLAIAWLIGMFFMGWKTVLWTCIGLALGTIIKQLRENV